VSDFSAATTRALARRGIIVMRPVAIPDYFSPFPFASASRDYSINDNGTGRVWTFERVMEEAQKRISPDQG
jgi:hypothetical protein